jgi:hypothetical protein
LPVVIVATEEALAAVPTSMREGSYACGASKWQTIRRIVLPRAMPGIMTGAILAMARGAGEVAPLMLVGAVKLAPELPLDGDFPVHAPGAQLHAPGLPHLRPRIPEPEQRSRQAHGLHDDHAADRRSSLMLNAAAIWLRTALGVVPAAPSSEGTQAPFRGRNRP